MNFALWIISGLQAVVYLLAGGKKVALPARRLATDPNMAALVEDASPAAIKAIGAVEVAGAVGLILPWLTGIAPILTPVAALGFVLLQVGAMLFHGRRREFARLPVNVVFLLFAAFVAWGRFYGGPRKHVHPAHSPDVKSFATPLQRTSCPNSPHTDCGEAAVPARP